MATGAALRLYGAGLRRLIFLEIPQPMAVRRTVSFSEAVYEGRITVEGVTALRAETPADFASIWARGAVPVLVDPAGRCVADIRPEVVVEATIAKTNIGVTRADAPWSSAWDRASRPERMCIGWWKPSEVSSWAACCGKVPPRPIQDVRAWSWAMMWNACCAPPAPACSRPVSTSGTPYGRAKLRARWTAPRPVANRRHYPRPVAVGAARGRGSQTGRRGAAQQCGIR